MKMISMVAMLAAVSASAYAAPQPSHKALAAGLSKYLAQQGDVCVGKFDWPIDVAPGDAEAGSRDAVQLPVLAQLGLAESAGGMVVRRNAEGVEQEVPVQRYSLTEAGKKFYLKRDTSTVAPTGEKIARTGDFCVGKLSLVKVVAWDAATGTASYTYKFAAAPWMHEPAAQQVFPMIAYIMKSEGQMQMKQRLRLEKGRWVGVRD
ncbi:hypothetical protein [Rugamonas rivuli]|uniref:DUF3108 domain-containing protein n=1 Tax=Rugamonas rivuli TaxID=2743358 RepID=A0A843SEA1_9BURK|nr:hypothetical protein [Rugamonas rivuli]MQA20798.1 hypothetical protein [Rugamonas rivuli]